MKIILIGYRDWALNAFFRNIDNKKIVLKLLEIEWNT